MPIYANGETIQYLISVSNDDPGSCDVDGVTLVLHLPAADGTPTGQAVTVATGLAMPAGTKKKLISTIPYKLALNPSVVDAVAQIQATAGLLHDAPADHQYRELKEVGTDIVKPTITIDKTGSIAAGVGPQNVTYTYEVTNTSPIAIPLNKVRVDDNLCLTPVYSSGDNGDGVLSQNEKWYFTCTMLHNAPGVFTNIAKACAVSAIDSNNEEVCSPPDTWTVTLTSPPPAAAPPQGSVKSVSVAQPKCTLATPSGLKVRKGEVTSIKVTVRNVDAGSVAKITLPDGKVVSAKTNSKGIAVLKVKPTKTGRATVKVAECSEIKRLTVSPARKTVSQNLPRVTG